MMTTASHRYKAKKTSGCASYLLNCFPGMAVTEAGA
jgi:hypothetical protein